MEKSTKRLIVGAVVALVILNVLIFTGYFDSRATKCYKDACLLGVEDPVIEITDLIDSSKRAIIMAEGDVEITQTTGLIDLTWGTLVGDFVALYGYFYVDHYGIEIQDGTAIGCLNYSLEFCQNLKAENDTIILKLKYPTYEKNEIEVMPDKREIEFKAISGADLYAMVTELFEKVFLGK